MLATRILARVPQGSLPPLHTAVARVLSMREGLGRGELASHWLGAQQFARAAVLYLRDGHALVGEGAYASAVEMLNLAETAFQELPDPSAKYASLLALRAISHWGTGDARRAQDDVLSTIRLLIEVLGGNAGPIVMRRLRGLARLILLVLRKRAAESTLPRETLALLQASMVRAELGLFRGRISDIALGTGVCLAMRTDGPLHAQARARGLSFAGYAAGLARMPGLADRIYAYGFSKVAADARQAANLWASHAVNRICFGHWQDAKASLAKASSILITARDPQLEEAVVTIEALAAHFQGDYLRSAQLFARVHASAQRRGNRLHEAWGLYGQAMALVRQGHNGEAQALLTQAQHLLRDSIDLQSVLICAALSAQAAARLDRIADALVPLHTATQLARRLPPTNFGSLEGFAGPVEAALIVARSPHSGAPEKRIALDAFAVSLPRLRAYARVFPIGRPCLWRVRAEHAALKADLSQARHFFGRAIATACELGMHNEIALVIAQREKLS